MDSTTTPAVTLATAPALARAVLGEIAEALAKLAASGETTLIDLRSLPLAESDLAALSELLGHGEVHCELDVAGRSEVRETGTSGVWWIRHFSGSGDVIVDEIAVTRIPDILVTHPDDVAVAAERLATMLAAPVPTHEEDMSRG